LHAEAASPIGFEDFAALVKLMGPRIGLQSRGSQLRLAGHDSTNNPRDIAAWQRVVPVMLERGALIASVRELSAETGIPLAQMRDLLHRKSVVGETVKITLERFALPQTMAMLRSKAAETARGRPDGQFTAAQFRDTIGTGRTLAIEILEYMDRAGYTRR